MSRQYPPFQCTGGKFIYIPGSKINTDIKTLDRYIEKNFSVVEKELLLNCGYKYLFPADFEYVVESIHPRFCVTKNNMGLNTQYLIDKLEFFNIMLCLNEYAQAFSILVWHYDGNNKIYISSVCSDQADDKARGSAGALINDLIKAASKTNEITHVFLDSVPSAIPSYKKYNFKETGNTIEWFNRNEFRLTSKIYNFTICKTSSYR